MLLKQLLPRRLGRPFRKKRLLRLWARFKCEFRKDGDEKLLREFNSSCAKTGSGRGDEEPPGNMPHNLYNDWFAKSYDPLIIDTAIFCPGHIAVIIKMGYRDIFSELIVPLFS